MENKILAIKGHSTRGNEIIKILEMLGGNNRDRLNGRSLGFYCIDCNNNIDFVIQSRPEFMTFYLEDFLEKYPYKVGDKVKYKNSPTSDFISIVNKMIWDNNQIKYNIYNPCCDIFIVTAEYLQPYKEETMEERNEKSSIYVFNTEVISFDIAQKDKYELDLQGKFKVVLREGKYYVERIKPQYPKTYNECCNVLIINPKSNDAQGYKADDIICFQELLIARDAYWKLAGDWEEKRKKEINHYVIYSTLNGGLVKDCLSCTMVKHLLDFPTEEMRDAFLENFKDLIEKCKEFL